MAEKFLTSKKTTWMIGGGLASVAIMAGASLVLLSRWMVQEPLPATNVAQISQTGKATSSAEFEVETPELEADAPATVAAPAQPVVKKPSAQAIAAKRGLFRISNPTDYPVRVALLMRKPGKQKTADKFELPAHWDFAPQEGSLKGLIVSLPNKAVEVKPGDVITVFSQDGSRRYWGPYVVGETPIPEWNPQVGEWKLTLEP
ncbi:MAG TPA: hypothetical protein IGS53_13280 [Leptolyngbyaceae cyanobacterium M33_DOE_097]|uniref:Uncharacterized protein n=1 Tax=Oscillatoriales cyanobacterium SpSt-418 TaxID=2282169 RepID=A0A7C3KI42_9CYAN|nr:hypothetical protein [Leptolyngbyaceae cyanobacterium M33_DOE_097]